MLWYKQADRIFCQSGHSMFTLGNINWLLDLDLRFPENTFPLEQYDPIYGEYDIVWYFRLYNDNMLPYCYAAQ